MAGAAQAAPRVRERRLNPPSDVNSDVSADVRSDVGSDIVDRSSGFREGPDTANDAPAPWCTTTTVSLPISNLTSALHFVYYGASYYYLQ